MLFYFNAWFEEITKCMHKKHTHTSTVPRTINWCSLEFAWRRNFDIMDSMLQKLEKYADNLENIVQERTAQLVDEKHKTDMLLYRMLPPYAFLVCWLHCIHYYFFLFFVCILRYPALIQLHWLPIQQRVTYKLAKLTFKTLSSDEPVYLRSLLITHQPARNLRSIALSIF